MAQQLINIGTTTGDGTGDQLRAGGQKINENFTELYAGGIGGGMNGEFTICIPSVPGGDYDIDKITSDKVKIEIAAGVAYDCRRLGSRGSTIKKGTPKLIWINLVSDTSTIHFYNSALGSEGIFLTGNEGSMDLEYAGYHNHNIMFLAINLGVNQWVIAPYGLGGIDTMIQNALSDYVEKETGKSLVADTEIAKIHSQNTDQYLDFTGDYQTSAQEVRESFNLAHENGKDLHLDQTGVNEVSAADIRTALDTTIPSKAPIDSPTFTTKITTPLIEGGSEVGSQVMIKATTGIGTAAGIGFQVQVGTDGATKAITVLNNGNTGIGVTNPARKLVVDGEAEFSGGVTTAGIVSGQSAIASGLVVNESGGNLAQDDFRVETVVNANAFVVDASANQIIVGVDLIAPKVIGGSSATADLILQTTTGVGAAGADMHFLVGNNGATEAMTILNDGKIGLAKIDPAEKLDVTGNINATGVYKVDGVQVLKEQQAAIPDMTVLFSTNPVSKSATTTIADGSTPTVNELIQYCVNLEEANKTILALLRTHGFIAT